MERNVIHPLPCGVVLADKQVSLDALRKCGSPARRTRDSTHPLPRLCMKFRALNEDDRRDVLRPLKCPPFSFRTISLWIYWLVSPRRLLDLRQRLRYPRHSAPTTVMVTRLEHIAYAPVWSPSQPLQITGSKAPADRMNRAGHAPLKR
jgi:hypothetical protein